MTTASVCNTAGDCTMQSTTQCHSTQCSTTAGQVDQCLTCGAVGAGCAGGLVCSGAGGVCVAQAMLRISPTASPSFTSTLIGQASATQTFTVTNGGGVPAGSTTGLLPTFVGGDTGDFRIVAGSTSCAGALGAGLPCSVVVTFNPTGPGLKSTSLSVSAAPGGTVTVALSGTGLRRLGDACNVNGDCPNGMCVDNHCCGQPSCAQCRSCTGAGGTCAPVVNAQDPGTCENLQKCDGAGTCVDRFAEFSSAGLINPFEIVAGPAGDRNMYVTDTGSSHIYRVSLQGAITPVATTPAITNGTQSIVIGPGSMIWFGQVDTFIDSITTGGTLTQFPTSHAVGGQTILAGSDGSMWFTEFGSNFIGHVPLTGAAVEFSTPAGSNPFGLAFASDGSLWASVRGPDQLIQMTVSGGSLTNPKPILLTAGSQPGWIIPGPGGNLWFTELAGNRLGYVTASGTLTEAAIVRSAPSGPYGLAYDAAHNILWFTEFDGNKIGRVTLSGGTVTAVDDFQIPTLNSLPLSIAIDPDGNVWFTEPGAKQIGRFIP